MKKVLITEKQLQVVKNQLLMENDKGRMENPNSYRREVGVTFDHRNCTFKGKEITDVTPNEGVTLYFEIDMEKRSWGVKSVLLYDIRGHKTLDIRVDYYESEGSNNEEYEYTTINLDWEKLQTEDRNGEGIITIADTLEINLANDENGNLVVDYMSIETYTI